MLNKLQKIFKSNISSILIKHSLYFLNLPSHVAGAEGIMMDKTVPSPSKKLTEHNCYCVYFLLHTVFKTVFLKYQI